MPLVKKRLTIAAGATSDQVLQGTTYEYVDPGTQLVVAAGDATGTYSGQVTMDFTVNNAEFSKDAIVSEEVTGEAFGWRCLLYTSPSPRDRQKSRMPSSA